MQTLEAVDANGCIMMTGPGDPPSIARRCRAVRERLRDLIRVAGVEKVPLTPEAVEDISDRFELWCGDLGALHEPPSRLSLEARLGDSPEMRVEVSEQVEDLHESLQDCMLKFGGELPCTQP